MSYQVSPDMPRDRNGVRYDPKRKPDNLEVFNGLTWWDMPGRHHSHDNAKMNFALFKRGLYDPMLCEDIADEDERKRTRRLRRETLGKLQKGNGAFVPMHEAGLAGLERDETKGPIRAQTDDDMAEVKQRAREWARRVGVAAEGGAEGAKPQSETFMRTRNKKTKEQRVALLERLDAVRAPGRHSRQDVLNALGLVGTLAFMAPSGLVNHDRRWDVIEMNLPALERGEIKLERALSKKGQVKIAAEKAAPLVVVADRPSMRRISAERIAPSPAAQRASPPGEPLLEALLAAAERYSQAKAAFQAAARAYARSLSTDGRAA